MLPVTIRNMSDVILKSRDLEIKKIEKGEYAGMKVVGIRPWVAFNEDFIRECESLGVKDKAVEQAVEHGDNSDDEEESL